MSAPARRESSQTGRGDWSSPGGDLSDFGVGRATIRCATPDWPVARRTRGRFGWESGTRLARLDCLRLAGLARICFDSCLCSAGNVHPALDVSQSRLRTLRDTVQPTGHRHPDLLWRIGLANLPVFLRSTTRFCSSRHVTCSCCTLEKTPPTRRFSRLSSSASAPQHGCSLSGHHPTRFELRTLPEPVRLMIARSLVASFLSPVSCFPCTTKQPWSGRATRRPPCPTPAYHDLLSPGLSHTRTHRARSAFSAFPSRWYSATDPALI